MPNIITNIYKNEATGGNVSLSGDTFYCALLGSTIADVETSAINNYTEYSDVVTYELPNGNGYATSGAEITGTSLSADSTNNKSIWVADDITWTSSTFTVRGIAIYKDGGYPLIGVSVFDSDEDVNSSSYILKFTNGILNIN